MRVAITGATGLIGTALSTSLSKNGHEIQAITRRRNLLPAHLNPVLWDPASGVFDPRPLEGADAWIHLAGETIAGWWTAAHKDRIRRSRVEGAHLLVDGLEKLDSPPTVFVSSSAIGFYGDRGDEELDEDSFPGAGFLPELCRSWEAEVARASGMGIRTVSLRTGLVLSSRGGALAPMLIPFKLALGGPVGSGRQWISWIHIDDLVGLYRFVMEEKDARGPLNATSPEPVRQSDFAKSLGRALRRPAFLPAPGFAIKMFLGEMGQTLLLEGQKVRPQRAQKLGYSFKFPELQKALHDILENKK
jgi:uncharacterized protein (TIGR01777 family)